MAAGQTPVTAGTRKSRFVRPRTLGLLALTLGALALATFGLIRSGVGLAGLERHTLEGTLLVKSLEVDDSCGRYGLGASEGVAALNSLANGATWPCPEGPGGGYDDLADGTHVTISDGSGKLLATGALSAGKQSIKGVSFSFTITNVPTSAFYKIQIAGRGELSFSAEDMAANDWSVGTTIGSFS